MEWLGKSRNNGVKYALGKYIFCTDADCTVSKDWIKEGLSSLADECVGVEGRIIYNYENYQATFSDYVAENETGGNFMTGNCAYLRDTLIRVGGFNPELERFHDRDIALRVLKFGRVCFNKRMTVVHPRVQITPKKLLRISRFAGERVYLFKTFDDRTLFLWRLFDARSFVKIVFPPLILASLLFHKFKTKEDYNLLPFTYLSAIMERISFWKACARLRVFLI